MVHKVHAPSPAHALRCVGQRTAAVDGYYNTCMYPYHDQLNLHACGSLFRSVSVCSTCTSCLAEAAEQPSGESALRRFYPRKCIQPGEYNKTIEKDHATTSNLVKYAEVSCELRSKESEKNRWRTGLLRGGCWSFPLDGLEPFWVETQ